MATSNYRTIQTNFTEGVQFVKNYIPNATFNNGSVNNWSKCAAPIIGGVLSTTSIVDFTAPSITTFTATNSTPISGSYSMQVGGTWARGEGIISDAFRIEREDLGKPLTFSFSYEAITNPLNANWSGILGSQTFVVYIYDETAAAGEIKWIQPSGFLGMNQNSGVGQVTGNFQSSVVVGQQYRLAIFALQAAGGAITVNFDNFSVGKETSTVGTPVTDWQQYTPTFVGITTTTSSSFFWRRVGDSIEIFGSCNTTGVSTSATFSISIPPGYTIDTLKGNSLKQIYGDMVVLQASNTSNLTSRLFGDGVNNNLLYATNSPTASTLSKATIATLTIGSSGAISVVAKIPITGLSSSVEMSNATDTRVVDFVGTVTAQSLTANMTNLSLTTVKDSHASWSTNQYVIPVSGDYVICGTASTSSNLAFSLEAYVDNIVTSCLGANQTTTAARLNLSTLIPNLRAGQVITIKSNVTINLNAPSIDRISIFRLSGPSVIAASENIICRYSNLSGTLSTSTDSLVTFTTKNIDTHNIYSSGVATIPISGTYLVSAQIVSSSTTAVRSNTVCIYKGVSLYAFKAYGVNTSSSGTNLDNMVTSLVPCLAGETISIKVNDSGATPTVLASSTRCFLSIVKVDK